MTTFLEGIFKDGGSLFDVSLAGSFSICLSSHQDVYFRCSLSRKERSDLQMRLA